MLSAQTAGYFDLSLRFNNIISEHKSTRKYVIKYINVSINYNIACEKKGYDNYIIFFLSRLPLLYSRVIHKKFKTDSMYGKK